jgi:membrane-associated PAP2 superfamily phosphatase
MTEPNPESESGSRDCRRSFLAEAALVAAVLGPVSAMFWFSDLDLRITRAFYEADAGWVYRKATFPQVVYSYGEAPAAAIAAVAGAVLAAGFFVGRLRRWRKVALFFVLVMAVGPGLVVNAIFKDHWGRPRPNECRVFGGERAYRRVWEKGPAHSNDSFPCGHASMGFYFVAPWFLLRKRRLKWAISFLALGLVWGSVIGLGRVMQGKHFASDVVWSAGFVYLIGLATYYGLRLDRSLWWGSTTTEATPPSE